MCESVAKKARLEGSEATETETDKTLASGSGLTHYEPSNLINKIRTFDTNPILPSLTVPDGIPQKLLAVEEGLTRDIESITFDLPVDYIYSPIIYAKSVHLDYLQKYCRTKKKILILGMNPGPWGMSQTGVPFGDIKSVKNYLNLSGSIEKPTREQPSRKVAGFNCSRTEVSGKRFWSFFKELSGNAETFFQYSFLRNYCPVALMDAGGRNITPAELKESQSQKLKSYCDKALTDVLTILGVEIIIAIGGYAEKKVKDLIKSTGLSIRLFKIPHPSPRAVRTKNWGETVQRILTDLELLEYFIPKVDSAASS